MSKSVLTAAIWLTLGVILGFAILLISEQRLFTGIDPHATVRKPARSTENDPVLIADLKAEVARLEGRLARLAVRPEPSPRLAASAPSSTTDITLDARPRTTRPRPHEPVVLPSLGEVERVPAPPEYENDAVIEGTVRVELGGRPVTQFTLGVRSENGEWARKEVKDLKGRFSWILDPGRARVFISAPGYADWLRTDLVLERGMVTRIKIRLSPARRLEGRTDAQPSPEAAFTRHAS